MSKLVMGYWDCPICGNREIRGCISCNKCSETGKCVFDDLVNEVAPKFEAADGMVVGSPVYYASPNGNIISFIVQCLSSSLLYDLILKLNLSLEEKIKSVKNEFLELILFTNSIYSILDSSSFNILPRY